MYEPYFGVLPDPSFLFTKVCPSYPELVLVPRGVDDSELVQAALYRQDSRFPVMAYRHQPTGVSVKGEGGIP